MKKSLAIFLLTATLATAPVLAQGPPPMGQGQPGGPGGPGGPAGAGPQAGPSAEVVLKEVLGLTDDQVTALRGLLETRRQSADALRAQLGDAEKALGEALKAANPDATQLGTLLLAVQAVRAQVAQGNEAFRTAFAALLTSDQQQKLTAIQDVQKALLAGQLLRQFGL